MIELTQTRNKRTASDDTAPHPKRLAQPVPSNSSNSQSPNVTVSFIGTETCLIITGLET